jgi:hypothetical protein
VLETWLVMDAAWKIWRDRWTVLFAGVGFTLTTPVFFYESKLYAEGIAVALIALLVWQMANRSRPWQAGLTYGLLILARPDTVLLTAIVFFYAWSVRPEPRAGGSPARSRPFSRAWVSPRCITFDRRVFVALHHDVSALLPRQLPRPGRILQPEEFGSAVVGQSRQAKVRRARAGRSARSDPGSRYWWKRQPSISPAIRCTLNLMRQRLNSISASTRRCSTSVSTPSASGSVLGAPASPALLLLGLAGILGARAGTFERWMRRALPAPSRPR